MSEVQHTYSLGFGEADVDRLVLLNEHYNPTSRALLESVGLRAGSAIADVGCGHGAMTAWMAERVGPTGLVYAVDVSEQQLDVARQRIGNVPQVRFVPSGIETLPGKLEPVDFVYARFLLLHLADPASAVRQMASLLRTGGALVLEVANIDALRFVPSEPAADLWKPWWQRLGRALGASYDVHENAARILNDAGLRIERQDQYQPISARRESKLLHALGFQQLIDSYVERAGAQPAQIEAHLEYLRRVIADPDVHVELYRITQYVAYRRAA
jgi:ubiquinone/menaquinone biosynthesis C-methylase UbiE